MKPIENIFIRFILTYYYTMIVITGCSEILFGGVSCYTEGRLSLSLVITI